MLTKAATLGADTVCMDLEDAVTPNKKVEARSNITTALETLNFGTSERTVRINPVNEGSGRDDLRHILQGKVLPDGIVIPKLSFYWELEEVHGIIEKEVGAKGKNIVVIPIIETAHAVLTLSNIIASNSGCYERLVALIFGADDFANSIGAKRTVTNFEVATARQLVVMHAKANGLQAIDMVNINFHDTNVLREECIQGFTMGYTGKQIIHPKQIEITHESFAPTKEEVGWAIRCVAADKENAQAGKGAFSMDGQMIDAPTVKIAQETIAKAKACGMI